MLGDNVAYSLDRGSCSDVVGKLQVLLEVCDYLSVVS